jgi:hypothetical protein
LLAKLGRVPTGDAEDPHAFGSTDAGRAPGPRLIEEAIDAALQKAGTPLSDLGLRGPESLRDVRARNLLPAQQDDLRPPLRARLDSVAARRPPEPLSLLP